MMLWRVHVEDGADGLVVFIANVTSGSAARSVCRSSPTEDGVDMDSPNYFPASGSEPDVCGWRGTM